MTKPSFNILVTDHTRIEWLATLFKISVEPNRENWIRVEVEWRRQPNWVHTPLFLLSFPHYELQNSIMNLYSFPEAIKRDFKLADLNIVFDGGLLILDLGNKKLWQRHVNRSHLPVEIWNDTLKNAIETHLYRTGSDDPAKIWGVELLNQIDGAKLILGIRSSSDCVPSTYIKKYLPLHSPVDIVLHDVNPDGWLDLYDSYPSDVIADTLVTMERKLNDNADALHRK
jgi:hypothetical protein